MRYFPIKPLLIIPVSGGDYMRVERWRWPQRNGMRHAKLQAMAAKAQRLPRQNETGRHLPLRQQQRKC